MNLTNLSEKFAYKQLAARTNEKRPPDRRPPAANLRRAGRSSAVAGPTQCTVQAPAVHEVAQPFEAGELFVRVIRVGQMCFAKCVAQFGGARYGVPLEFKLRK